jgi:sporulation protein YlmC with PRC-barrel domain
MYARSILLGGLAVAFSGAAMAQTPAPSAPASPAAPSTNMGPSTTAPRVGDMTSGEWWLASKLKGVNVYNNGNEKIGDISDVVIAHDGKADKIIISVGGFLGMGTHYVGIAYNDVKWVNEAVPTSTSNAPASNSTSAANRSSSDTMPTGTTRTTSSTSADNDTWRGYPDHIVVNMTKDQLKAAPEFKYTK